VQQRRTTLPAEPTEPVRSPDRTEASRMNRSGRSIPVR